MQAKSNYKRIYTQCNSGGVNSHVFRASAFVIRQRPAPGKTRRSFVVRTNRRLNPDSAAAASALSPSATRIV